FSNIQRHFYRQQWLANLFLPTLHALGSHELKFGIDFERESFHQENLRHDYLVLREDNSVARQVSFFGGPFQERKNFESAHYFQGGAIQNQIQTAFLVNDHSLIAPYSRIGSFSMERKLPGGVYWKAGYTRRVGNHGFAFVPFGQASQVSLVLANARRERYDAFD